MKHNLIPKDILDTIPDLYSSCSDIEPMCLVKLFTPDSSWSWYIMELNKEDNDTCFGYVVGLESELGYFSLNELANIRGPMKLRVEIDLLFKPTMLSEIKDSK
jgi:hypothetical protein